MPTALPWVFGFVLGLAFLLLLVSFRSVVVAFTGVVLNLLSVAAAYGMLVFVFQDGHFESVLDFRSGGGITNWMPLFLFIILFGLSMDYHVFVLSRIREGHDRGLPTRQAVREGIGRTAGVITSAAMVMVAVFALFATLPLVSTKELGVGLAAAVLLDATIIRAVLLPAVMALLGDKNWWLPRWLGWLPPVAHDLPPAAVDAQRPRGARVDPGGLTRQDTAAGTVAGTATAPACAITSARRARNGPEWQPGRAGCPRDWSVCAYSEDLDLKASLMFSPACLSFELDWSALPSASRDSSSVALPTPSLTLPVSSSDLLSILSSAPMVTSRCVAYAATVTRRSARNPGCAGNTGRLRPSSATPGPASAMSGRAAAR